jgi:diadenosine tetraphosphate (Ap4A) HIT family hydrolase
MQCIFCEIIAGQAPASVIRRDEKCLAFLDIHPINPGHLLVVPISHAARLADLDPETGAAMFQLAHKLAEGLRRSGLRCEGISMHLADGEAAGQEVLHIHLHVIPRLAGDGLVRFLPDAASVPRHALDEVAATIKGAMNP